MLDFDKSVRNLVKAALEEDIGPGDITSQACLEPERITAKIVAKSEGILSGLKPALMAFQIVDSTNKIRTLLKDGDRFKLGDTIIEINGFNQSLLASERVALNFLAHLCGVATLTGKFVDKVRESECRILDTRKTTPGWRFLEKEAVVHGGGVNHRYALYDMVLIKDNHIAAAGSITQAVIRTREFLAVPDFSSQFGRDGTQVEIEVEITSPDQLKEAISVGVNRLLLDNQSSVDLRNMVKCAREINPDVKLEASGNVTLDNVSEVAATGVDYISIGALTHSVPASDLSMRIVE
ncbi:MAG: carboxylating nicotinate-nucleotide diphosphorylase [Candidatus Zixiibacteriota bacterium]|nr:MAG: carboxylating nicotinate-nucleotide diphosphorylase [candidate division Zixibacteria bacterium]